jgi:hypothetical protein
MPMALVMRKVIDLLRRERIEGLLNEHADLAERFGTPGELLPIAQELGDLTQVEMDYLEAIPSPLLEGVRAAIVDTISSGRDVYVSYAPGYDFSVSLHDSVESVSVHLTGPYPPNFPRQGYEPAS